MVTLKHRAALLALILPLWMMGCADHAATKDATDKGTDTDTVGGYVDVINYNHNNSYKFTLFDLTVENTPAISGGIVWWLASGGNVNCCIALPKIWRPGLKVLLDWHETDRDAVIGEYKREFEIPRYTRPGNLFIVFLPKSEVELVVSEGGPGPENWPGSIKQTPWDYCVQTHGRKACVAALPKTFDADGYSGSCTRWKRKNMMDYCEKTLGWCIKEYEDEEFCNKVLWGKEQKGCLDRKGKDDWCEDQKALSDEYKKKYLLNWENEQ
jgi:hypothetical protein